MKIQAFTPARTAYQPQKVTKTEPATPPAPTTPSQRSGDTLVIRKPYENVAKITGALAKEVQKLTPHFNPADNLIHFNTVAIPERTSASTRDLKFFFWNPKEFWPERMNDCNKWNDTEEVQKSSERFINPTDQDLFTSTTSHFKQIQNFLAMLTAPPDRDILNVEYHNQWQDTYILPKDNPKSRQDLFRCVDNGIPYFRSYGAPPGINKNIRLKSEAERIHYGKIAYFHPSDEGGEVLRHEISTHSTPFLSNQIGEMLRDLGFAAGNAKGKDFYIIEK